MRRSSIQFAGFMATMLAAGPARAQGVGLGLTPAMPEGQSALTVTPQAGPWMILAASYSASARAQAEELANEIRNRYRLPAYVFNRTAEEKRAEQERVSRIKEEQRKRLQAEGLPAETPIRVRTVRIEDQFAVLVGGFKDDVTARKELDKIRKLKPSDDHLQGVAWVPDAKTGKMHEETVNPFQSAFVCRNPTVPVEKPVHESNLDARLKEYNRDESYSLLKCPKRFSLVVKAYKAPATIQSQSASSSVMDKVGFGRKTDDLLNANARQAHQVAEFLRKFGCEAYALHTEYNSYVTIGGFDSADDPRLVQMQRWFVSEMKNPSSNIGQLNVTAMVHFLDDPMPMPVPQIK